MKHTFYLLVVDDLTDNDPTMSGPFETEKEAKSAVKALEYHMEPGRTFSVIQLKETGAVTGKGYAQVPGSSNLNWK